MTSKRSSRHLLNDVTVWDVAVERCLEVTGPDGFKFAQLLTPRDLSKCAVGQAKYVLICDSDGGIINDPVMTRMEENTFWFALASSDVLLFARGLKNAYPDLDVTLGEVEVAPMQIQGPRSKDLMRDLVGPEVVALKYYFFMRTEVRGIPVVLTRTGWTSEVGYELYLLDAHRGRELWQAVMEAGAPYDVRPTGPSDIRRIEGGIFNWGADMTYDNNPLEMGLERLVDWNLPDSAAISLPALRQIQAKGVHRRIVGVEIDGEPSQRSTSTSGRLTPPESPATSRRQGHVGDLLAAPAGEHRFLLGAARRWPPKERDCASRPNGATERLPSCRCPLSTRASASRSPSPG